MIRNLRKYFWDYLLFSNIFIACCAMAQGALTYLLLHAPINANIIALLGCATLFLYNFSMILSKPMNPLGSPYRRVRWIFSHYTMMILITLAALAAIIPLALALSSNTFFLLAVTGIFALSYNIPLLKIGNNRFGLRKIPGAKTFIIAAVWSLSCVCVPIVELKNDGIDVLTGEVFILALKRFLFIIAITIPFDIRDLFQDQRYNLKTIPVMLGEKKALLLCQVLLIAYISLLLLINPTNPEIIALAFITLLTGWLIFRSKWEKNERFYFLYIDGTLILQFLAVWIAQGIT